MNETFVIRVWKPLPRRCVLKTLRESLKGKAQRTISACGGLERLLMVSELDIGRCANEEAEPQRGWTRDGVPVKMLDSKGGGLEGGGVPTSIGEGNECRCWARRRVDCEIPHRLRRRMKHSLHVSGNISLVDAF